MRAHLQSVLLSSFWLLILMCGHEEGTCQIPKYDLNPTQPSFVVIPVNEENNHQDSIQHAQKIKWIDDHIQSINAKLANDFPTKKFSSFPMEHNGKNTLYIVIRPFEDFASAERYAQSMDKELDRNIFREIGEPFPISQSNYRGCVVEKDFQSYFEFYQDIRH